MDGILQWMQQFGYLGIAVVVALENLFPPIPSEVVLPFAGFLTLRGSLTIPGVILAATAGSVVGALILYAVGLLFGRERIYVLTRRYGRWLGVREAGMARAEDWFARSGASAVFLCRMVPVVRSLVSIPAGLVRMNPLSFIVYTAAGTLLWNTLLVGLGAALGAAWERVADWVGYYQDAVIAAAAAAAAVFLWRQLRPR